MHSGSSLERCPSNPQWLVSIRLKIGRPHLRRQNGHSKHVRADLNETRMPFLFSSLITTHRECGISFILYFSMIITIVLCGHHPDLLHTRCPFAIRHSYTEIVIVRCCCTWWWSYALAFWVQPTTCDACFFHGIFFFHIGHELCLDLLITAARWQRNGNLTSSA